MLPYHAFGAIKVRLLEILASRYQEGRSLSLPHGGLITCRKKQHIRRVTFHEPGLILVLQGVKSIYIQEQHIHCQSGEMLAIPAPSCFDMINQPVSLDEPYLALFLGFNKMLLDRLRQNYGEIIHNGRPTASYQLHLSADELLYGAISHYLQIVDKPDFSAALIEHRLLDLLLCLINRKPTLHMLLSLSESWRERIYAILLTEPGRKWQVADICAKLAVSESTLRRRLNAEGEDFLTILQDLRLGMALVQIQMTHLPIYEVAIACGYQSASQFTRRFRERFGLTPSALRNSRAGGKPVPVKIDRFGAEVGGFATTRSNSF